MCSHFQDVVHTARVSYHKPLTESLDVAVKQAYPDKTKGQIRIIDAGAGTGLVGEELAKLGYTNVDALDISQEMLNEAEKKKVYTKFFCAPLNEKRNPEIETGAYDVLVCVGTLLAAHVRAEALEEMIRMVKTGKTKLCLFINTKTSGIKRLGKPSVISQYPNSNKEEKRNSRNTYSTKRVLLCILCHQEKIKPFVLSEVNPLLFPMIQPAGGGGGEVPYKNVGSACTF